MALDPEKLLTYQQHVRRLARALLRDQDLAEDVSQDAMAAALSRSGPPRSWRAWLSATVRNCAVSALRRESGREAREERAAAPLVIPSPEKIVQREDARRAVVNAVLALDPIYRTVLILRYFESLPPRRIAQELSLPVETVRTRIRRGLEMLRADLRGERGSNHALQVALIPLAGMQLPKTVTTGFMEVGTVTTKAKVGLSPLVLLIVSLGVTLLLLNETDPPESTPIDEQRASTSAASSGGERADLPDKTRISSVGFKRDDAESGAAEDAPALGSLRIRLIRESTGEPIPNQLVTVLPFGGQDPFFSVREVQTDRHGEVLVGKLAEGGCYVTPQLGKVQRARVKASEETLVVIKVSRGMIVKGVVVDGSDRPVPGAEIHVSAQGKMGATRKIGVADALGRFEFEADAGGLWRSVGARADGYAPSHLHMLSGPAEVVKTIKVVLEGVGGTVTGVVRDPDDKPVANAYVLIGRADHRQFKLHDGHDGLSADPIPVRTNSEGRFVVKSLAPGKHPIRVKGRGLSTWSGEVEVRARQSTNVQVSLLPGVTISGTIKHSDGAPAASMRVIVGQYGSPFCSYTRTRTDGTYLLRGVSAGDVRISATHDTKGNIREDLSAEPGARLTWDATLECGPSITGRVLDERKRPLSGWTVVTLGYGAVTRTKSDGTFTLENLSNRPQTLKVLKPGAGMYPVLERKGVHPGGRPITLVVEDARVPTSTITGEVVGADGEPVAGARVSIHGVTRPGGRMYSTDKDGRFVATPVPAGEYKITVRCSGLPSLHPPNFSVGHSEELDLGTLKFPTAGGLHVTLRPPQGKDVGRVWVGARRMDGRGRESLERKGLVATHDALAPGKYLIVATGRSIAQVDKEVVVEAGKTTKVALELHTGFPCRVTLTVAESASLPRRATLRIENVAGKLVRTVEAGVVDGELHAPFRLLPGSYEVRAAGFDGSTGSARLTVVDGASGVSAVNIVLSKK